MIFASATIAVAFSNYTEAAPITYTLGNTFSSPYFDVNVSITTDGTLGPITPADVLSWHFLVHTFNGRTYEHSSSSLNANINFSSLIATNTDLLFQLPPPPPLTPIFVLSGPNALYPHLPDTLSVTWTQQSDAVSVRWSLYDFSDTREFGHVGIESPIPADGIIQAPEPSTLALAAIGVVALLAVRRRHSAR